MAINSTQGLPSFSEMYNAYKNRGGLADVINAGTTGYFEAKAAKSKENLQAAEAEKNRAEAKKASMPKAEGVVRIDQILDPKEKAALAQYAQPNDQGLLVVPISTYNAITKRSQGQENLDLHTQLATEQSKAAEERAANAARLAKVAEEKAALQATLGPKAQAISANRAVAESAGTVEPPTLLQRGVSLVKEKLGGTPLSSVLAERQAEAARAKLADLGNNTVDQATGITPTDPETLRLQGVVKGLGLPVTDANIAHAKAQGL